MPAGWTMRRTDGEGGPLGDVSGSSLILDSSSSSSFCEFWNLDMNEMARRQKEGYGHHRPAAASKLTRPFGQILREFSHRMVTLICVQPQAEMSWKVFTSFYCVIHWPLSFATGHKQGKQQRKNLEDDLFLRRRLTNKRQDGWIVDQRRALQAAFTRHQKK